MWMIYWWSLSEPGMVCGQIQPRVPTEANMWVSDLTLWGLSCLQAGGFSTLNNGRNIWRLQLTHLSPLSSLLSLVSDCLALLLSPVLSCLRSWSFILLAAVCRHCITLVFKWDNSQQGKLENFAKTGDKMSCHCGRPGGDNILNAFETFETFDTLGFNIWKGCSDWSGRLLYYRTSQCDVWLNSLSFCVSFDNSGQNIIWKSN